MTSGHENGANPANEPARHRAQEPVSASTEAAYERLSAYGFARRYAQGKTVADLDLGGAGYGSRLLAQSAESVTALADLPEPALPDGSFDVVVAFGTIEELEHPEELVREAKRVLKEGGVLLVSVADKRITDDRGGGADGRGGMYVPEFRGLLERHFGHVRLYRQGAVAGGFVFPVSGEPTGAVPVESVRLSSGCPGSGTGPPRTRSVVAVCTEAAEVLGEEERAYLLLDREGRVFDESEEHAEDVELLLGEIRRMQETEVQAYLKTLSAQQLPLGAFLRLIPQILLYYLYYGRADSEVASRRQGMALARARHRLDATLVETRHRTDVILAEARHRRNVALEEARHRLDTTLAETGHRREVRLDEMHHRRNEVLAEAHRRREVAFAEARHRRNVALDEIHNRQEATLAEARHRRDLAIEEARHRRNVALEAIRHRRNLIITEIRHRRNLTLEQIIHRRNIIRGNVHALRQKDAKGLARGAFRRSSALYRWLRGQTR
jgi:SAM-dependent methyltransferase